jgi:hypothetical protein
MRAPHQGKFKPQRPEKYVGDVQNVFYRSGLEFRVMRYFDRTPGIISWSSEEVRIPYISPVDARQHTYFPDFLIKMKHKDGSIRSVLIEVKPDSQTKPPKLPTNSRQGKRFLNETATYNINQAKWQAAQAWCQRQNATFMILTEQHIDGRS